MKPYLYTLLVTVLLTSCGKKAEEGTDAFGIERDRRRPEFYPEMVSFYPDTMKLKLRAMLDSNVSWDSIVLEASKLIAKDTMLLARDSLKNATVLLYVKPPYENYYARLNGFKVKQQEVLLSLFPDTICLAIGGYGMQRKFEGSLFINGVEKTFKIEQYRNNTDTLVKIALKEFKTQLPRKPKVTRDSVPVVRTDSAISQILQ